MAYALLNRQNAAITATASTIVLTPSFDIPAGTLVIIGWCCTTASRTATCADTASGAQSNANVYTYYFAGAGATLSGGAFMCYTTRDIISANFDTITVTMNSTATQASVNLVAFTGASADTQLDVFFQANTKTASPITMGATPTLTESGSLVVAITGWKGGNVADGFTTSSGYTTASGLRAGTTTSCETDISYKLSAGTAAETPAHSFTSITAGFGMALVFRPNATLPAPTLFDDFTGAAANIIGRTGWGSSAITSGDLSPKTDGTTSAAEANGTPASAGWGTSLTSDQEVAATITTMDSFRLYTRMDTVSSPVTNGYRGSIGFNGVLSIDTASGTTKLTGTLASAGTLPAMDWNVQSLGSHHSIWQRTPKSTGPWRVVLAVNDATTNAAGFVGFQAPSGDSPSIDKIYGGSIGSVAAVLNELCLLGAGV